MQKSHGQSSVEYLLLLLVITLIAAKTFQTISDFVLASGDCPNAGFLCQLQETYKGPGYLSGDFRRFTLRK
jgi:hypothetical protein